jgi:hypothetical protein
MADVTDETMTETTTINAPSQAGFAVLTDPGSHASIAPAGSGSRVTASGSARAGRFLG